MSEQQKWKAASVVIVVIGLELLFGPGLLYLLKSKGVEIYSASLASQYPGKILLQWGVLSIYPAILVLVAWLRRKKNLCRIWAWRFWGKTENISNCHECCLTGHVYCCDCKKQEIFCLLF